MRNLLVRQHSEIDRSLVRHRHPCVRMTRPAKVKHKPDIRAMDAARSDTGQSGQSRRGVISLLTLIRDADLLLPANPADFNIGLEIW